jgi:hypothetical protein
MSGFVCPKCGEVTQILPSGGGKGIAEGMNVPFLGAIPMDPKIAAAGDSGHAWSGQDPASPMAHVMNAIIARIAGHEMGGISRGEAPGGKTKSG